MSFEPIIRCNDGITQQDLQLERLSIHDFTRSTGIQTIVVPEFSIFLLGSAVTSTEVRYVWQRRLDLARRLLRETGAPLVDVALACGYASQSHFTTAFKMAIGVTPAAYQRGQSDP